MNFGCGNIRINGIYGLFAVSLFLLNLVLVGISYVHILRAVFRLPPSFSVSVSLFCLFLRPHRWRMEVPRLGVEL